MMALFLALACGGSGPGAVVDLAPVAIGEAECGVCGMVVGEQPSPRGQLVYRDGSHTQVCSVDELRALAESPGARGRPVAVYVETLPADHDWTAADTTPQPWSPVSDAAFVFGAERPWVMGVPVLAYASPEAAAAVAARLGTHAVDWAALASTPVPQIPNQAGFTGRHPSTGESP
ncbi:MAG: nitrous oxide reductase accessory protein NosL [Myxococcota bacterium]|jgi:nitrous oxide reductase accessory protein NosL